MKTGFFLTFFNLIFMYSCSSLFIKDFSVTDFSYNENYFKLTFSTKPEINSIKKSLTLSKDNFTEYFTVEQTENSLLIYPYSKIEKNHEYSISISTEAENIYGTNLSSIFRWNFSTKSSLEKPEIKSCNILPNGISIFFNKSINTFSFSNSFSITPDIQYFTYWQNDDKEVSIIFQKPQTTNERYFIKISTDLKDTDNYSLQKEYTNSYIYNPTNEITTYTILCNFENEKSELSSILLNENIRNNSEFLIKFSNPIQFENINSNIKITPPLDFSIQKDIENQTEVKLKLNELPDFDTEYILHIDSELKDINNNLIPETFYKLKFNNTSDIQMEFLTMIVNTKTDTIKVSTDSNYPSLYFSPAEYPVSENNANNFIDFILFFSISNKAQNIDYISAIENIQIDTTLNCLDLTAKEISILTESDIMLNFNSTYSEFSEQLTNSETNIRAVKFHYNLINKKQSGLITVSINKDLKDLLKNTLNKNIFLSINKG